MLGFLIVSQDIGIYWMVGPIPRHSGLIRRVEFRAECRQFQFLGVLGIRLQPFPEDASV